MDNPFKDPKTGVISFPYKPLRDVVFIWPDTLPERVGSIIIPEYIRANYANSAGTILATGKGCYVPKFKKWTASTVRVGDYVMYDSQLPFSMEVEAPDGNKYTVKFMGQWDCQGIIRG